jgi:hypothetical protein
LCRVCKLKSELNYSCSWFFEITIHLGSEFNSHLGPILHSECGTSYRKIEVVRKKTLFYNILSTEVSLISLVPRKFF